MDNKNKLIYAISYGKAVDYFLHNSRPFIDKASPHLDQACSVFKFFIGIIGRKDSTTAYDRNGPIGSLMNVISNPVGFLSQRTSTQAACSHFYYIIFLDCVKGEKINSGGIWNVKSHQQIEFIK